MKLWCLKNDARYRTVDPLVYDKKSKYFRVSLLIFKWQSSGFIFLNNDNYSNEYRASKLNQNQEINLTQIEYQNDNSLDSKISICDILPQQVKDYRKDGYGIIFIGLQQYTFEKVDTNIPFLPDSNWIEQIHSDELTIDQFKEQYKNKLIQSQERFPKYWKSLLKKRKYAICNHRDVFDYDYSNDFIKVLIQYFERHWMDTNLSHIGI